MTRTRHACDDSTHMTNFDIETARAMYRITEAYHPDLEAAGLMRVFDGLEAARTHAECLRVAEAETHPLWREYMARLERQQVTQAFRDAGAAYEALHRTGQAETTEGFKALLAMFTTAPEWLRDEFSEMLHETGLVPDPIGFNSDGKPLYAIDDVADKLGITADEVRARADELGLPNAGPVIHTLQ
jgi:hypothetical protein